MGKSQTLGLWATKSLLSGRLETAEAGKVIDASGDLVSPPFVDPHFHMDATLSYGLPRINTSGTLLEGIGLWGELKQVMTQDDIIRTRAYLLRLGSEHGAFGNSQPC